MPITFYQASAGSGKTTELVNFYLSICMSQSDHGYFKHILAMTFTVKAAQEMKLRVLNVLKKVAAGEQNPILEKLFHDTNLRLQRQHQQPLDSIAFRRKANRILTNILHRYSDFSIMTLDAFFNRIVSAFAYDLNIPLDFQIIMNENELLKTAVDVLIESIGKDPLLTQFILSYYQSEFEAEKNPDIEKMLLKLKSLIFSEKNINYVELLHENSLQDFYKIKNTNNQIIKSFEKKVSQSLEELEQLIQNNDIDFNTFNRNFISSFIKNSVEKDRFVWNETIKKVMNGEAELYSKIKKKEAASEVSKIDSIADNILSKLQQMRNFEDGNIDEYVIAKAINKHIEKLALIYDLVKIIRHLKEENSALTFQDISYMISRVIAQQHTPFVYERVGVRYHHFLIDEFQDTSVMQFYNVLPLILESNDEFDNLIVGDAKQAIYRFRNGEVELIRNLPRLIPALEDLVPSYYLEKLKYDFKTISLANNFRSADTIVDFNNSFFDFVLGNFSFENQVKEIYQTVKQEKTKMLEEGYVDVKFLPKSKKEDIEDYKDWLIDTITRCKNQNFKYKQIAILVRKNKVIQDISKVLLEHNIPFVSSESLTLGSNQEVKCIFSALQYLKNPMDNLAMFEIIHYFYSARKLSFNNDKMNASVFIQSLLDIGIHWDEKVFSNKSVLEIFYELLFVFQIELDSIFINQLHDYFLQNSNKWLHISDALEWWEDTGKSIFISLPEDHDAVKIMTYHKAKGLEFEVVICPFVKENYKIEEQFITLEEQTFIVTPTEDLDKALQDDIMKTQLQQQTLDNLNNLYVAFTRACKRLYIATYEPSDSKKEEVSYKINFARMLQEFCLLQNQNSFSEETFEDIEIEHNIISNGNDINSKGSTMLFDWKEKLKAKNLFYNEKTSYGQFFHEYASQINFISDQENVFLKIDKNNELEMDVKMKLKSDLQKMVSDIKYSSLLLEPHEVINEKNIYSKGKIVRPDKIFIHNDTVTIIDFKTGKENDDHKRQIVNYKNVMLEMGYSKINPILIYSETLKIVEL